MAMLKVKGYEINVPKITNSFNRRAQKFKNDILINLRMLGLTEDDVILDLEPIAMKNVPAKVVWYFDGHRLEFSHKSQNKYVENLCVISKIIEKELQSVADGNKTIQQFVLDFSEDDKVEDERKAARELLGVEPDCQDLAKISKIYKKKAMKVHPDMENGDHEEFQALNRAHKILKRELE